MFGALTDAFGFTVLLCLAPSLLVALVFPPILLVMTRPKADPPKSSKPNSTQGKPPTRKKRGFIKATVAFAQFYFVSLVVLVMASVVFWWVFIVTSGTDAAADFAVQSFPAESEAIEEIAEPELTTTP